MRGGQVRQDARPRPVGRPVTVAPAPPGARPAERPSRPGPQQAARAEARAGVGRQRRRRSPGSVRSCGHRRLLPGSDRAPLHRLLIRHPARRNVTGGPEIPAQLRPEGGEEVADLVLDLGRVGRAWRRSPRGAARGSGGGAGGRRPDGPLGHAQARRRSRAYGVALGARRQSRPQAPRKARPRPAPVVLAAEPVEDAAQQGQGPAAVEEPLGGQLVRPARGA